MNIGDFLSDDGTAILALCSHFGLLESPGAPQPLKPSEWNALSTQIENSSIGQPSELNGKSASELAKALAISTEDAEQITQLLGRTGKMALEVERLFSRGMWVVTRADAFYPANLLKSLAQQAPPVLFGAGSPYLLNRPGIAVIGSRNIDEAGAEFAREVGRKAVQCKRVVVSGGARGTDRLAMDGALDAGGAVIGALADSLETTIRKPDVRDLLLEDRLVLFSPYVPSAGFSVGAAMGRNKYIYGQSEAAVVVSSDYQSGGTWAGAVEALKAEWCPVFVRSCTEMPKGNRELEKLGAVRLPEEDLPNIEDLSDWFRAQAKPRSLEQNQFDFGSG